MSDTLIIHGATIEMSWLVFVLWNFVILLTGALHGGNAVHKAWLRSRRQSSGISGDES